jgi:hypothetical protein
MGVGACRRRASSSTGSRACWVAEPGRQRHRPRAQLGARHPQRIRGLVGVAGLDPPAARAAAADVDLVADARRAGLRQLLHMLGRDPFGDQLAAAARAPTRQPDHHDPVDPLGWLPVRVPAVGRAGLAPGTLGISLGSPLENGAACRLAARRNASTSPPSRSLASRSRSPSTPSRSFSPPSRSRSTCRRCCSSSSRCCSSPNAAFSSSRRAMRPCSAARPARSRTAPEPTATVDTRPEGCNQPIHRQGPAISITRRYPTHVAHRQSG